MKYIILILYLFYYQCERNFTTINTQKQKSIESQKKDPFFSTLRVKTRLIKFFEQKTYQGRTKLLNNTIREKIMDKSDYIHYKKKKIFYFRFMDLFGKMFVKIMECLKINKIPLFNPEQTWRITFNCIIVIFNCFYLYVVSLKIAYNSPEISNWQHTLMQIAQVVWIADMIIQMNTAMYHHNEFTEDRRVIMKIFLKEYFFFEVLPIIFENLHSSNFYINILFHLPLLLKMKEFYILQMLENHSIFLLFKLFMKMILFGHILACCRNSVISYETSLNLQEQIWSSSVKNYESDDQFQNYLENMFWAFSLMLNVSHPTPTTKIEIIFTSCCMLISCIIFGYLLTSIGSILSQLSKGSEDYKRDLNILNQYMKRKKIEIGLKRRANISLKKFYDQQVRIKITEERATLDKVDNRMFRELLVSSNERVVGFCPILSHLFTKSTLEQLCVNFEEVFYSPHETIINNNEKLHNDCFLYIVIEGKIRVHENYQSDQVSNKESENDGQHKHINSQIGDHNIKHGDSEYNGEIVQKGQYFGLIGFMLGRQVISQAESLEYSTLLRISRSEVERIIQNNTKDKEKFMEMRDRILYSNDISNLFIECVHCQSKSHFSQNCNLLHFDKFNPFLHMRNNFSLPQNRQKQSERLKLKYMNALIMHKYILDNVFELRSNYGIESSRQSIIESEGFLDESLNTNEQSIAKNQKNIKDQSIKDASFAISSNPRDENNKRDQINVRDQQTKEQSYIKTIRRGESNKSNDDNFYNSQHQEERNDQEKRTILDVSDDSFNLMDDSDSVQRQNKANSKQKKERSDRLKQAITYKFKNDESLQPQSKKRINSFNEIRQDDQIQQYSSQIGNFYDASKYSQQSFHNIKMNETVLLHQHIQPQQQQHQSSQQQQNQSSHQQQHSSPQFHLSKTRVKSLIEQRDEELFTYDLVEDEIVSRQNIQKLSSNLFQKGHGEYFHDSHLEKFQSQGSLINIQRIPTLETILRKQSSHVSTHNAPQISTKPKLYSSTVDKQSNATNQLSKSQRKKNSLNNSCSININTQSLVPSHSLKDNRSYMGSRKEQSSPFKGKTRLTVVSTNSPSFQRLENEVKNFISVSKIDEDYVQDNSDKQVNRQEQRQLNQDKKFYWYFDKLFNFQFYFFKYNSETQIKKYNSYIQSKKNRSKVKVMPNLKKDKLTNQL